MSPFRNVLVTSLTLIVVFMTRPALAKDTCFFNDRYQIVFHENYEPEEQYSVLAQTFTNPASKPPCVYKPTKNDFIIDETDDARDQYGFEGLQDQYLILNAGSVADNMGISIFDLQKQKLIGAFGYSGEDAIIRSDGVEFWITDDENENRVLCDEKDYPGDNPAGYRVETQATFDFKTQTLKRSAKTQCGGLQ